MHQATASCALLALAAPLAAQCGIGAAVEAYGQGTPGTGGVPELRGVGGPLIGLPYHVKVLRGPGSAPGLIFAGLVEVDVAQPFFGGAQYVGVPYIVGTFALDAGGDSPPLLALKVDPAFCGLTAVAQAAVIDPGAQGDAALTNGLRVRFGIALGPLFPAEEYFGGDGASGADVVKHADLDGDGALELLLAG